MANRVPSPMEAPALWERLVLLGPNGRLTLPNVTVNVRGGGLQEDSREVKGQNGSSSTTTFLGYRDAEVEVVSEAYTKPEFERQRAALELYRNKRQGKPVVLDAVHPNLELHGIKQVYLFSIDSDDYSTDTGFVLKLSLKQWQSKTTVKTSALDGSGAGTGDGAGGPKSTADKAKNNSPSKGGQSSIAKGFAAGSQFANQLLGNK